MADVNGKMGSKTPLPEAMRGNLDRWKDKKTPATAKRRLGTARCAVDAEMEPIPVDLLSPNVTFRKVRKDAGGNKAKGNDKEVGGVEQVTDGKENRGFEPQEENTTRPWLDDGRQEENQENEETLQPTASEEGSAGRSNEKQGYESVVDKSKAMEPVTEDALKRWDRGLKRIQEGLRWLRDDGGKDAHVVLAMFLEGHGAMENETEAKVLRKCVEAIDGYVPLSARFRDKVSQESTEEDYRSCRSSLGEQEFSSDSRKDYEDCDADVADEVHEEEGTGPPQPRKLSFGSHTSSQSEVADAKPGTDALLVDLEKASISSHGHSEDDAFHVPSSRRPGTRRVHLLLSDEEAVCSPSASEERSPANPKPSTASDDWLEGPVGFSTAVRFQISEEAKRFSPQRTSAAKGRGKPKRLPKSPFIDDQATERNHLVMDESDASEPYESSFINDSEDEEASEEEEEYEPESEWECSEVDSIEVQTRRKAHSHKGSKASPWKVDSDNEVGKRLDFSEDTPSLVDRISRIRLGALDADKAEEDASEHEASRSVSSDSEDDGLNGAIVWKSATKPRRTKGTTAPKIEEEELSNLPVARLPSRHEGVSRPAGLVSFQGGVAAFRKERGRLTQELFREYNLRIFEGKLPLDLLVQWNNKLTTTAGLTHYKREVANGAYQFSARVELSSKVVDAFPKLQRTLCHELCHVAAWLLDHTAKPPHGPVFKKWACLAMDVYPDLEISTCHHYEIHYPYRWKCGSCLKVYGRHSNSIKPEKHACGICRGRLEPMGKFKPTGSPVRKRAPSAYTSFVKAHFAQARSDLGEGVSHGAVMRHLSHMWQQRKSAPTSSAFP